MIGGSGRETIARLSRDYRETIARPSCDYRVTIARLSRPENQIRGGS